MILVRDTWRTRSVSGGGYRRIMVGTAVLGVSLVQAWLPVSAAKHKQFGQQAIFIICHIVLRSYTPHDSNRFRSIRTLSISASNTSIVVRRHLRSSERRLTLLIFGNYTFSVQISILFNSFFEAFIPLLTLGNLYTKWRSSSSCSSSQHSKDISLKFKLRSVHRFWAEIRS